MDIHQYPHVIAGAFFRMQKKHILQLDEINKLVNGEVLFLDVFPHDESTRWLLSSSERQQLLKQLGARYYLEVSSEKWPFVARQIRKKQNHRIGFYQGPYMLEGLDQDGINAKSARKFLSSLLRYKTNFNWYKKLGYMYPVSGKVAYGNQIGRQLGYPTANLDTDEPRKIIPPMGVYAGWVKHDKKWYRSMINVGIRPTLNMDNVTIEAHIFDFSKDIYEQEISIHFYKHIREEMKFPSLSKLTHQLSMDRGKALKTLEEAEITPWNHSDFIIPGLKPTLKE